MKGVVLIFVAICLVFTGAFNRGAISRKVSFSRVRSTSPWKVDEDTAEIECGSSIDIKRIQQQKEKLESEARLVEVQARHQNLLNELSAIAIAEAARVQKQSRPTNPTSTPASAPAPAPVSTAVAPVSAENAKSSISTGTSGFDIGLLLAFPIIIGTLGFFFLFPILGPQIATQLPPVPTM
jgi:hypothetical protein